MGKKQKKVSFQTRLVRIINNELKEFHIEYGENWDCENVHCNSIEQAFNYAKFESDIMKTAPADQAYVSEVKDLGTAKVVLETAKPV